MNEEKNKAEDLLILKRLSRNSKSCVIPIILPNINKPYLITALIFIFGILMYSNGIFDYFPWYDEFCALDYSDTDKSFLYTFKDPGNPPLFYILFRFFMYFTGISYLPMKNFPFLIENQICL